MPARVKDKISDIRGRIIWLEPIDMETIPIGANLLASILVRVEDAIARLGNVGRAGKSSKSTEYMGPGLLESGPEYHSIMLDLQRVQNAIALAWEGNLQQRSSQIDPDAYAVELLRSENARLSVNKNLDEVLNMIARKISWAANIHNPVFLLPVDDLDLNPLACLELLRLLRMISVPRIFSLILGDIYIAEIVMNLKLSGDLAQVANQGVRSPQLLSLRAEEIAAAAGEVSANAMRKLIPPNQRIFLENMDVVEALKFKPLDTSGNEPTLYRLLSQYPMSFEHPPHAKNVGTDETVKSGFEWSLKDFLVSPSQSLKSLYSATKSNSGEPKLKQPVETEMSELINSDVKKSIYTGLYFLQGTPRATSDLWFTLNHLTRFKDEQQQGTITSENNIASLQGIKEALHNELVKAVAKHCRTILGEERGISPTERIRFKDSIRPNIKGNWEMGQLPLRVSCKMVALHEFPEKSDSVQQSAGKTKAKNIKAVRIVHVNKATLWDFEVRGAFRDEDVWGSSTDRDMRGFQLSSEASSAIVILHDLLALGPGGSNYKSPLLYQKPNFFNLAATVWQQDANSRVELPWPSPVCKSFWELDIFKSSWKDSMEQLDINGGLDWAAFVWISVGTSIVDRIEPVQSASKGYVEKDLWTTVIGRLEALTKPFGEKNSQNDALEWLTRVFLMVMPENGLSNKIYLDFVNCLGLRRYWLDHYQSILPRRTSRLATMVENNLKDLAFEMIKKTQKDLKELSPSEDDILNKANIETAGSEQDDNRRIRKKTTL
jgi:hypothetical protein